MCKRILEKRFLMTYTWKYIKMFFATIGAFVAFIQCWREIHVSSLTRLVNKVQEIPLSKHFSFGWCIFIVGVIYLVYLCVSYQKCSRHIYKINEECCVQIICGDILKQENGSILIGINQQFENSKDKIGENSIHSQLLSKLNQTQYDELNQIFNKNTIKRKMRGKTFSWNHYVFLVMSNLKSIGCPATDTEYVKKAFQTFLNKNVVIINKTLYCPVLGKGAACDQVSFEDRLMMLIQMYIQYVFSAKHIRIHNFVMVIHPKEMHFVQDYSSLQEKIQLRICTKGCYPEITIKKNLHQH